MKLQQKILLNESSSQSFFRPTREIKNVGNLQINDNRITGLTNSPNADDEAANKKYVDDNISKANIKPSHTPKNVFQYLMDDVNE